MSRYFIEVAYIGTRYNGFQVQENAQTIQHEVEKAFALLHSRKVVLTGSSRTDTGVHALQNFFHFDDEEVIHSQFLYKMNAVLPSDIVLKNVYSVGGQKHARFDALSRLYCFNLHSFKNPFLHNISLYYPYQLDTSKMVEAASIVREQTNFFAFAKTNTQVKTFECKVVRSEWYFGHEVFHYHIEANRFLRGMVRLLTASQLKVGRGHLSIEDFRQLFSNGKKCGFSVPAHGLMLKEVKYPPHYFLK